MTLTQIKERYTGIQTKLKTIDTDGCLFLCLCSIIEEVTNAPADIIGIIQLSKKRGWLSDDFTVNDSLEILRAFTGKIWKRTEPKKLPETIKDNEFSIEVWQKPNSKAKHFKRRFTDTLTNSQTVKIGSITEYYIYSY